MIADHQILSGIAASASTMSERLAGLVSPEDSTQSESQIEARLTAWAKAVGKGDMERLEERLALDGLTLETVRPFLGRVCLKRGQDLPPWVFLLPEIVAASSSTNIDSLLAGSFSSTPYLDVDEPLPFEEILSPWVILGNRLLSEHQESTPIYRQLSETASAGLARYLLTRLSLISAEVFQHEFWLQRMTQTPILGLMGADAMAQRADDVQSDQYHQFVRQFYDEETLWEFFKEYSLLARLLVEEIQTWVSAVGEFLTRLDRDWAALDVAFGGLGEGVGEILAGLSDPHNNGRTVFQVSFASGIRLIYKPHSLAMDGAYHSFVEWTNKHCGLPTLKTPQLLEMGSHGWVEFIDQQPCQSADGVERFYTRLGILIAVMYLLSGADFHYENVIAHGEFPMPVDLEMLLYPPMAPELGESASGEIDAWQQIATVFASSLLPFGNREVGGGVDASYVGAFAIPQEVKRRRLKYINSDFMHWDQETIVFEPEKSKATVFLEDELQRPQDYMRDILAGFEKAYRFFLHKKSELLTAGGPLSSFQGLVTRFVFRPTRLYYRVWISSLAAEFMRDGIDRHIQLEHLGRVHTMDGAEVSHFWDLYQEESAALRRNDIPIFHTDTSQRDMRTPDGKVLRNCFSMSGHQRLMEILKNLSKTDLERQSIFIRQSLYAKRLSQPQAPRDFQQIVAPILKSPLGAVNFRTEAERIAAQLIGMALFDGRQAIWATLEMEPVGETFYPTYLENQLYSGSAGLALFLAALWQDTHRESYRRYAQGALFGLRQQLERDDQGPLLRKGIGGASGIGSLVYALTRCALFLNDESLLADAQRLACSISPGLIEQDEKLDLIAGSAGAILGLLSFHQATQSDEALERAVTCGQHLLSRQVETQSGGRAWPTVDGKLLTGFSHGAAGIVYALLKLYQVTGDEACLLAAKDGIAFETYLYDPQEGNWPDLRYEEGYMSSWCHGAPGIALGRMGGLSILDTEAVRSDIALGLESTLKAVEEATADQLDHLCCGQFGRAEILFSAAQMLGEERYKNAALGLASTLVTTAHQNGGYHLLHGLPRDLPQPGFFNGLAGIGYACLRFAQRVNPLPSVLLWE
jgi:type 2 lantibiotic biosynthesis protein LanM